MTVRLYLDVDGVLNALAPHKKWGEDIFKNGRAEARHDFFGNAVALEEDSWGGLRDHPSFPMRWSEGLIDALNELDVELVWLTTWRQDAPGSVAPLMGIKHEGRVLHPLSGETTFPSIGWKFDALMKDLEENTVDAFIWADDEIYDLPGVAHYALAALNEDIPHVLVAPDSTFGITPEDVSKMQYLVSTNSDKR